MEKTNLKKDEQINCGSKGPIKNFKNEKPLGEEISKVSSEILKNELIGNICKKDLVGILQNHKLEILKNSLKKYEEASVRIDAYWNDLEYDAYEIPYTCIVSQLRISGWGMEMERNIFTHGKNIETAVFLYGARDKKYELLEYSRGETPEKAYDSLIERLQKN